MLLMNQILLFLIELLNLKYIYYQESYLLMILYALHLQLFELQIVLLYLHR